jgi:hypothetical protein
MTGEGQVLFALDNASLLWAEDTIRRQLPLKNWSFAQMFGIRYFWDEKLSVFVVNQFFVIRIGLAFEFCNQ